MLWTTSLPVTYANTLQRDIQRDAAWSSRLARFTLTRTDPVSFTQMVWFHSVIFYARSRAHRRSEERYAYSATRVILHTLTLASSVLKALYG